jgi:hypothetical protein
MGTRWSRTAWHRGEPVDGRDHRSPHHDNGHESTGGGRCLPTDGLSRDDWYRVRTPLSSLFAGRTCRYCHPHLDRRARRLNIASLGAHWGGGHYHEWDYCHDHLSLAWGSRTRLVLPTCYRGATVGRMATLAEPSPQTCYQHLACAKHLRFALYSANEQSHQERVGKVAPTRSDSPRLYSRPAKTAALARRYTRAGTAPRVSTPTSALAHQDAAHRHSPYTSRNAV